MGIRIIVDSTTDLTKEYKERVKIVPLTVHFGEKEYIDGVTLDHKTFYDLLVTSDVLPTTSAASPGGFANAFQEAREEGDDVICIAVSSKLSGTYQSAVIGAMDMDNVYVIDSGNVTLGAAVLVEEAFRMVDEGMNAKDIVDKLEEIKEKVTIVAALDTLEYLHKGGRLPASVAFVGTLLNIKPIVSVIDGVIEVVDKARGSKSVSSSLLKEIANMGGIDYEKPVMLGYTGNSDKRLANFIDANEDLLHQNGKEISISTIGTVVGTHAGPGCLGVAFFRKG